MDKIEKITDLSDGMMKVLGNAIKEVSELLPNSHVEHIGSTAVPIVGKQEIDIMVICFEDINKDSEVLAQHGYVQGPVVDEISYLKKKEDGIEIAVQIMSQGNKMIETHRKIIAKLREDEALYKKYEAFKWSLDGLTREEYKKRKTEWMKENLLPLI